MSGKKVANMLTHDEESRIEAAPPQGDQPAPQSAPQLEVTQPKSAQPEAQSESESRRKIIDRGIVGLTLVVIGVMTLAANLWSSELIGLFVLPALGVIFLAWGFLQRRAGLMIPGGILTGLGLGTLAQQTLFVSASGEVRGALVVMGLALGFLVIMPLSQLVEGRFHWWPAIPGGILLIISLAMLAGPGGAAVLNALGTLWPVALIAVGAYLLWMMYRSRGEGGERDRERHGLPS